MLVPMAKVRVIGHHCALDPTLEVLQQLRLMHLVDVDTVGVDLEPLPAEDARPLELDRLRSLRARFDAFSRLRSASPEEEPGSAAGTADGDSDALDALTAELDELTPQVELLVARLDELTAEADALARHVASLRRLVPLMADLGPLERYETVAILVDRRHEAVLNALSEELASLTGDRYEVFSAPLDTRTIGAAIVFPPEASGAVHALLGREQVSQVRLPVPFEHLTFGEALAAMERRLRELPDDVEATRRALDALLRPLPRWRRTRGFLEARIAQLEARRRLGATRQTFVISGWVPRSQVPRLTEGVAAGAGDAVAVEVLEPTPEEQPPTLLSNPAPARPFEFLVGLLALPRYGTIDPTLLMSVFMPLFFGIMLGDIVYGTVLLAGSVWVGRRFGPRSSTLRALSRVLMLGAAWAVVWGVVYGEALGDLGRRVFGLQPIWISREESLEPLLVFAVAVGAAHVALGLVLGIWAAWHAHQRRELARRAATLLAVAALFLLAQVAAGRLPGGVLTPAVAALVVGLGILIGIEGLLGILLGPLELLGVLGNVLSYLRLAAIGLASVQLARVANELGTTGPVWLGVVVAALFHALNLALGAFSPTIQALRLHYVEFFGRFYEEGGQPYEPFGGVVPRAGLPAPGG